MPATAPGPAIMPSRLTRVPPRYLVAMVSGGLFAGLLVFLAVQAMPILGWILWVLAIVAAGSGASLWYKSEYADEQRAEEDNLAATRRQESDRSRAELRRQRGLRRTELLEKYGGDQKLVERIVVGAYWDGQTAAQLMDELGDPADIDASYVKGKRQETWKYHPVGGNRYALWITLEVDQVIRWEQRA